MRRILPELLIVFLLAAIHLAYISLPPSDQDVGGITYNAMLIGEGGVPYRDSFEQKLPGSFFIVALALNLFGNSVYGLNSAAFLWNGFHLVVILWGVRRLWGRGPSRWAAVAFVLATTANVVDGVCPNYELWMNPPLTAGILLLLVNRRRNPVPLVMAGALVAGGVLVKQQAMFSALAVLGWLAFEVSESRRDTVKSCCLLVAGVLAAATPILLYFLWKGELLTFFALVNPKGAITYASGSGVAPAAVWRVARQETMRVFHDIPILFYAGTSFLLFVVTRIVRRLTIDRATWLLLVWILGACLGVVAGMRFYTHYYIQVIPPLSVAVGWLTYHFRPSMKKNGYHLAAAGLLAALLLWSSCGQLVTHLRLAWWQVKAAVSDIEAPTINEQRLAERIRGTTQREDGLLVWGHAEGMYFLAQRLAPTRYYKYWAFMRPPALTYGPPELNPRAEEHSGRFLEEIFADPPGAVVVSTARHDAPVGVFPAFQNWLHENYHQEGAFDQKELWLRNSAEAGEGDSSLLDF